MKLYRAMKSEPDGYPKTGQSARTLGVRPGPGPKTDIPIDKLGNVQPKTGGMSSVVDDCHNLVPYRRPPEFGSTGKDPVFIIEDEVLPNTLIARQDGKNSKRYLIEPSIACPFTQYEQDLHNTRQNWSLYLNGNSKSYR